MRKWALTILTIGIVLTAGHARAQTYDPAFPVCLKVVSVGTSPYFRCSYTTMEQCRASANGQTCSRNPYYANAAAPVKHNKRRSPAHADTRSYVPVQPPAPYGAPRYNQFNEPYYGASQGYAPGEKEQFLQSLRRSL